MSRMGLAGANHLWGRVAGVALRRHTRKENSLQRGTAASPCLLMR